MNKQQKEMIILAAKMVVRMKWAAFKQRWKKRWNKWTNQKVIVIK